MRTAWKPNGISTLREQLNASQKIFHDDKKVQKCLSLEKAQEAFKAYQDKWFKDSDRANKMRNLNMFAAKIMMERPKTSIKMLLRSTSVKRNSMLIEKVIKQHKRSLSLNEKDFKAL